MPKARVPVSDMSTTLSMGMIEGMLLLAITYHLIGIPVLGCPTRYAKYKFSQVSPAKKFLCINIITQEKFHIFPTIFRGPPSMCNFKIMVSVLLR